MARMAASSFSDNLPFQVFVNSPYHQPPHAHLMDNATGRKELGQFLIPISKPRVSSDIKDYKQGISDDARNTVLLWMRKKNKLLSGKTNWESLRILWKFNENH
jgi:hypothetical protein